MQGNETTKDGQAKKEETETENSTAKRTLTNHALLQDSQPVINSSYCEVNRNRQERAYLRNHRQWEQHNILHKRTERKASCKRESRNIHLQTLTDDKQLKTYAIQCLEVADWKENIYLPIPEVFVQPIQIDKEDIPKKSDGEKWPYKSTGDRFPWNRCRRWSPHWDQCAKSNGTTSGHQQPKWWAICMSVYYWMDGVQVHKARGKQIKDQYTQSPSTWRHSASTA